MALDQGPKLVTLPPPPPPSDLIASALMLPLHAVASTHRGRKLRLVGQVLAFHPPTSLLLLTGPPSNPSSPSVPSPTLLVNISTPLLGQSPSISDISSAQDSLYSRQPQLPSIPSTISASGLVNREKVTLNRGEWVSVVGWLEGDGSKMVRKVKTSNSYLAPLPLILEAIHIANSHVIPPSPLYRGQIAAWDGIRIDAREEVSTREDQRLGSPITPSVEIITVLDDDEEVTPRPRKSRRNGHG
ncbi:hypothetical protein CI109_103977 [Kwoniella shandongensis]|uniref:Uncharacterized protein n=1 Tax=Kwoniella shandongensis TaxID=1734106 RepID=A0A5M6BZD2_9TREE|nr:uncharacterized protein CI109_004139 [Kwoniella shandongensis]KAA5527600.1 hypothetical protein CI109_004139 [Kwoniella shandongensis]